MTSDVPKFTSFRPKPKASTDTIAASEPQCRSRSPENSTRSKEKRRKKAETRAKLEPKTPGASAAKPGSDEHGFHKRDSSPSKLFFSDRRGDPDILKYGCPNRYAIPASRPIGFGSILGLPPSRKIDRERSTDKMIVLLPENPRRRGRLLSNKNLKLDSGRELRFVQLERDMFDMNADFIPISIKGNKKCERNVEEEYDNNFRGYNDSKSTEQPLDSDIEYDSDAIPSALGAEVTQRNSELIRKTRERSEDVQAWIELAEHQEALMRMDRTSFELNVSDKQQLADVRISIYEQALKKIPDDRGRITLYAALLGEAQRAWGVDRLTSKWEETLTKFPLEGSLWIQYLDFVQTCFTNFKYDKCLDAFFRCLSNLQSNPEASVELRLHILIRLTSMIRQAGYQELAIAAWQALLEFHLLKPASRTVSDAHRAFEEFWESEVARIGETGAKGWSAFDSTDPQPLSESAEARSEGIPSLPSSPFRSFYTREFDSTLKLRYPGRTLDEVGEDDAFHIILFSDIERFLHIVPQDIASVQLVTTFLRFCGLPGLVGIAPPASERSIDPFLYDQFKPVSRVNVSTNFAKLLSTYMNSTVHKFYMTIELLFDRGFPDTLGIVEAGFVRRVLKLVMASRPADEAIGEYLLAFELRYFSKDAFKTAKKLLKAHPSSLRLYNAYGLLESRSGNVVQAEKVFGTAIGMEKSADSCCTSRCLDLLSNWVWEALKRVDAKEALWRLVSPNGQVLKTGATDDGPDQGALLRARSVLSETKERALLGNDHLTAVKATELLALLVYLSGAERPDPALAIHEALSEWFLKHNLSTSPAAELHAQSIAHLLIHHSTNARIVKPSLIRLNLEPLIAKFPENTLLLSAYAANEARFVIDDRVRTTMHQNVLEGQRERTIVGWAFAIHHEMLKGNMAGSTSHSIRALFKKAEEGSGAYCPAVWKCHILFELEEARKEAAKRPNKKPRRDGKRRKGESSVEEAPNRVKETFLDGMTHLPWNKDYIMMAFTHLGEEFLTEEELRKVYHAMVEKELRLYVELDD